MTTLNVNGNTYTDDTNALTGLANGGHRKRLLPMFNDALAEIAAQTGAVLGTSARFLFDAATAASDPGPGLLRFNNAAAASATALYLDVLNAAGNDVSGWLAYMGSGSGGTKGLIMLRNASGSKWRYFNVTGVTNSAGYYSLAVGFVSGSTGAEFASGETLIVTFNPVGPAGAVSAAADGTVAAPGISFASQTGLGFYRQAAGVIRVASSGADLLSLVPATTADAQAGADVLKVMTPARVADAITALAGAFTTRSARSANAILAAADKGKFVDVTANSFTQTFTAAATLGNGWSCFYGNSGSGDVTLDPNGSELIDGLTSFIMYPGEVRLITCDGAGFTSRVLSPFYRVFTASGTFVKPPGYREFGGIMWSGGSSGSKGYTDYYWTSGGHGGGGGGGWPFFYPAALLAASTTVTVGAGGAPQTVGQNFGNVGGATVFAGLTVYGGTYGVGGQSPGGSQRRGQSDSGGAVYGGGIGGQPSVYGGAGGGDISGNLLNTIGNGSSIFGGAGGASSLAGNGVDGTAPGGGGGATGTGAQSGAGARGEFQIWGIC